MRSFCRASLTCTVQSSVLLQHPPPHVSPKDCCAAATIMALPSSAPSSGPHMVEAGTFGRLPRRRLMHGAMPGSSSLNADAAASASASIHAGWPEVPGTVTDPPPAATSSQMPAASLRGRPRRRPVRGTVTASPPPATSRQALATGLRGRPRRCWVLGTNPGLPPPGPSRHALAARFSIDVLRFPPADPARATSGLSAFTAAAASQRAKLLLFLPGSAVATCCTAAALWAALTLRCAGDTS
jgi:hypothetical protein